MTGLLTDRYGDRLAGVLSCYDRIVITGTLPGACFAEGMTRILKARGIRVFDYPTQFATPLRDRVREAAARLAAAAGITIEHIAKSYIRKEDVVAKVLTTRVAPGPGACDLGDGGVRQLPAMARQTDAPKLFAPGQWKMPSLLFLFYGCRVRPGLFASADVVPVSPAVLL
jgi:hypothetical protein